MTEAANFDGSDETTHPVLLNIWMGCVLSANGTQVCGTLAMLPPQPLFPPLPEPPLPVVPPLQVCPPEPVEPPDPEPPVPLLEPPEPACMPPLPLLVPCPPLHAGVVSPKASMAEKPARRRGFVARAEKCEAGTGRVIRAMRPIFFRRMGEYTSREPI